jgi:hypothetical protein
VSTRGRGFKPRHCILDGCKRFASYYIKEKLKIKVAKWGTPKKIIKKKKKRAHNSKKIQTLRNQNKKQNFRTFASKQNIGEPE